MKTDVWGKHMWYSIHFIALAFPENPTNEDKRNYQYFFENLHTVLPCYKCSVNYIKHLKQIPIHIDILQNAERLFRWTVDIHNLVNAELGKRLWTHDEAFKFYNNFDTEATSMHNRLKSTVSLIVGLILVIVVCGLSFVFKDSGKNKKS